LIEDLSGRVPAVAAYPEYNYLHGESEKTYDGGGYFRGNSSQLIQ